MPANMQSLYQMFRINPGMFPGTNPGVFNNEINSAIPESIEKQREAALLSGADHRAEIGIRDDLAKAEAVRGARERGFTGTYPLQEQEQDLVNQKLRQVLLPKQMELEAAQLNRQESREFTAGQNQLNRDAMQTRIETTQQGQDRRLAERGADIAARSVKKGNNPLRKLFGGMMGVESNEDIQAREAAEMRNKVRTQMNAGQPGQVLMRSPDGSEEAYVDAARVNEFLARGGVVVE